MRRRGAALAAVLLVALLAPSAAGAATNQVETPGPNEITEAQAIRIARGDSKLREETRKNGILAPTAELKDKKWGVGWFSDGKEVALVYIDPHSGEVEESWTGYQVAWEMARGYPGAFAHKFDAVWIFVPFCLFFLLGLVDWKRLWRVANLDLLVLLGFVVSFYFFNRGDIGVSVPLQYPPLVYFLGRCLWIGFRGRGEGLRPIWPATWLIVAALFLMGVRVGLNMADAGAIDVGYAGVVGADKIAHGEAIYGNFPEDIHSGDTYGPVNYFAYLPFERIWPYSGEWDDLPAAHGASVAFDLLTFGFLILLGLRIRPGPEGKRLAAILAFGWAAYPYTGYVLESDSNDALVAALLVATLLVMAKPIARGATLALATWAKFVPAVLAPMYLTYDPRTSAERPSAETGGAAVGGVRERKPRPQDTSKGRLDRLTRPFPTRRGPLLFALGFAVITVAFMTWPAIDPGLKTFWERSIGAQAGRSSPFSVWGQVSALEPLRDAILAGTAALAVFLAFRPRRKSLLQVSAFSAALLLGVQLTLHHWFYLYIVWWFPLLLFALATLRPGTAPDSGGDDSDPRRVEEPAPRPAEEPAASPV
jgi:hypothetical protein